MQIDFTEWKSCINEKPEQDGDYIVIGLNKRNSIFHVCGVHYTVKYGWNTDVNNIDHVIDYADDADGFTGHRYFWSKMTYKGE